MAALATNNETADLDLTSSAPSLGFVGLGVMGGAMCRNVALKHAGDVVAFDAFPAAFDALDGTAASRAQDLSEVAKADIVFLSLPGGPQVEEVCLGPGGLARGVVKPSVIVDLSTTSVEAARSIAKQTKALGVTFVDAPVARTREAAERGELSIMVGAADEIFALIAPYLAYFGSDITHCGGVGCGQVVKLVNNALVFEHTMALAEMMVVGERAGVDPEVLLDAVSKGSGDSFVLRNHGRKSMLPRTFPTKAFPPEYALKDIGYVLELASDVGVSARVAEVAKRYYQATADNGFSGAYFPAVIEVVDQGLELGRSEGASNAVPTEDSRRVR